MEIKTIEKKTLSSNSKNMLVGKVYMPNGEIKGYFHIVHGMTEHIARYDRFMKTMAMNGYITFGYDHLGHGYTATDDSELGFIAPENGDDLLERDVKLFADAVKADFGEYPYYLMGHSMGSFVVRMAVQKYTVPDKLIIMGTSGPNPIVGVGLMMCKLIRSVKGPRHISPLVESLAFGNYNNRFKDENDCRSWLTNDINVRRNYDSDKFCTFKFTISAMHDLITMNKECNTDDWFKNVAPKMPILLVSGKDDPVGDYGKGIRICENSLLKYGSQVTVKLYTGYRHEILNDSSYDMVVTDILNFIK